MSEVFMDSFSNATVVDLKKSERNENGVLYALKHHPRVSTWDMSENAWLRNIIKSLQDKKLIEPLDEPYPWHKWKLTEEGEREVTV